MLLGNVTQVVALPVLKMEKLKSKLASPAPRVLPTQQTLPRHSLALNVMSRTLLMHRIGADCAHVWWMFQSIPSLCLRQHQHQILLSTPSTSAVTILFIRVTHYDRLCACLCKIFHSQVFKLLFWCYYLLGLTLAQLQASCGVNNFIDVFRTTLIAVYDLEASDLGDITVFELNIAGNCVALSLAKDIFWV